MFPCYIGGVVSNSLYIYGIMEIKVINNVYNLLKFFFTLQAGGWVDIGIAPNMNRKNN